MAEFDELSKTKEEQDERLESMRNKNNELASDKLKCLDDIQHQSDEIIRVEHMIRDTKLKKAEKELQKKEYEQETIKLREEIETQKEILEEEKVKLQKIRQENK